jgi:hypothetical protein
MPKHSTTRSTGDMISSVVFFCFGLWLLFEGLAMGSPASDVSSFGLCLSGAICIIATFRFIIAEAVASLVRRKR